MEWTYEYTNQTKIGLPYKPTKIPMPPVKPPKKSRENIDKLIYNMAKYIAELDIDFDICSPMCKQGKCELENTCSEYDIDVCIECIKKWFSEDR